MILSTLIRMLNDHDGQDRVRYDVQRRLLLIGRNFALTLPTIHDREIEKIHEERQGLYRQD